MVSQLCIWNFYFQLILNTVLYFVYVTIQIDVSEYEYYLWKEKKFMLFLVDSI